MNGQHTGGFQPPPDHPDRAYRERQEAIERVLAEARARAN